MAAVRALSKAESPHGHLLQSPEQLVLTNP